MEQTLPETDKITTTPCFVPRATIPGLCGHKAKQTGLKNLITFESDST